MSFSFDIEQSVKGNILILDPRSKVFTTLIIVIGISLSIDFVQVTLLAMLLIPLIFFYRPNRNVIKRIVVMIPIMLIITIILSIFLTHSVKVSIFGYTKTYSPIKFILLNNYRFIVSLTHTSILLESESSNIEIIEALGSLPVIKNLANVLLLIHRIFTRLQLDYNKMYLASIARNLNQKRFVSNFLFRLRILSKLLMRATYYSEAIGYTLTARGFNTSTFKTNVRNWSSEGLTIMIITIVTTLAIISIPF